MIEKKIEEVNYRTVYVAADGKEFEDKDACKTYDKTFACAMKSILKKMCIRDVCSEEDLFYTGSCETEVYVVIPKSVEDILHIKQFAFGICSSSSVDNWISENDINKVILITVGYDNEWVYVSKLDDIVANITNKLFTIVHSA